MPDPWLADIDIAPPLARSLVETQFPDLAPARLEPFGEGWDNAAFLVNGEWVFRFPRRKFAVPLLEAETRVLPGIAKRLPLPVPVPERVGRAEERYPYLWAGYRLLAGTTADRAGLSEAQRAAAAPGLGRFLRALHGTPTADLGVGGDTIGRMDVPRRQKKAMDEAATLLKDGAISRESADGVERAVADVPENPDAAPVLLHGDLYLRHVLVDAGGRPAGVIDWGDVHVGDPAVDLMLAFQFLPPAARGALFDAYGKISETTLRRARFRAVIHVLAVLPYAIQTADSALRQELDHALEWATT